MIRQRCSSKPVTHNDKDSNRNRLTTSSSCVDLETWAWPWKLYAAVSKDRTVRTLWAVEAFWNRFDCAGYGVPGTFGGIRLFCCSKCISLSKNMSFSFGWDNELEGKALRNPETVTYLGRPSGHQALADLERQVPRLVEEQHEEEEIHDLDSFLQ